MPVKNEKGRLEEVRATLRPDYHKARANLMYRSVFIHMPKCGGTFIRENFYEAGWWVQVGKDHLAWPEVPANEQKGRLAWTMVRHPIPWLISYHAFQKGRIERGQEDVNTYAKRRLFLAELSLEARMKLTWWDLDLPCMWVEDWPAYVRRVSNLMPWIWSACVQWFTQGCAFVGQSEKMTAHLIDIMGRIGEGVDNDIIRSWQDRRNVSTNEEFQAKRRNDADWRIYLQANWAEMRRLNYIQADE